jgi:hypothetical protein
VKPAVEFALEQFIDRAVAIEPGHARKGFGDDANAEMGFAGSIEGVVMIAACVMMAGVQMAFVDHQKTLGGEAFVQRCFNAALP